MTIKNYSKYPGSPRANELNIYQSSEVNEVRGVGVLSEGSIDTGVILSSTRQSCLLPNPVIFMVLDTASTNLVKKLKFPRLSRFRKNSKNRIHRMMTNLISNNYYFYFNLQLGANALHFLAANLIGLIDFIVTDVNQRKAFMETREALNVKISLEQQNKEQVYLLFSSAFLRIFMPISIPSFHSNIYTGLAIEEVYNVTFVKKQLF